MTINPTILETAVLTAQAVLQSQELSPFLKKRWLNALEKAKERILAQPYFAWQPERLTIVSIPQKPQNDRGCRFYQANQQICRRIDCDGLCQAFYEGFPCWHRAAFLLLGIYFGEHGEAEIKIADSRGVNQS